jgi:hypothetical protein
MDPTPRCCSWIQSRRRGVRDSTPSPPGRPIVEGEREARFDGESPRFDRAAEAVLRSHRSPLGFAGGLRRYRFSGASVPPHSPARRLRDGGSGYRSPHSSYSTSRRRGIEARVPAGSRASLVTGQLLTTGAPDSACAAPTRIATGHLSAKPAMSALWSATASLGAGIGSLAAVEAQRLLRDRFGGTRLTSESA